MLLYPPINEIREKADSRYTLVVLAAKRARDLIAGKPALVDVSDAGVPISVAAEEIMEDLITYSRPDAEPEPQEISAEA
jgi:DNA-directed RNA polymerase subunit omega